VNCAGLYGTRVLAPARVTPLRRCASGTSDRKSCFRRAGHPGRFRPSPSPKAGVSRFRFKRSFVVRMPVAQVLPSMTPASKWRTYRLEKGVLLSVAAMLAGLSLARASEIERFPERARPGELERLQKGVDRALAGSPCRRSSQDCTTRSHGWRRSGRHERCRRPDSRRRRRRGRP
jgi:hypothetical protein